jgi:hypothetical protein
MGKGKVVTYAPALAPLWVMSHGDGRLVARFRVQGSDGSAAEYETSGKRQLAEVLDDKAERETLNALLTKAYGRLLELEGFADAP